LSESKCRVWALIGEATTAEEAETVTAEDDSRGDVPVLVLVFEEEETGRNRGGGSDGEGMGRVEASERGGEGLVSRGLPPLLLLWLLSSSWRWSWELARLVMRVGCNVLLLFGLLVVVVMMGWLLLLL